MEDASKVPRLQNRGARLDHGQVDIESYPCSTAALRTVKPLVASDVPYFKQGKGKDAALGEGAPAQPARNVLGCNDAEDRRWCIHQTVPCTGN
jgi:hypothetical protein